MPGDAELRQEGIVGLLEIDAERTERANSIACLALVAATQRQIEVIEHSERRLAEHRVGFRAVIERTAADQIEKFILLVIKEVKSAEHIQPAIQAGEAHAWLFNDLEGIDRGIAVARQRLARDVDVRHGQRIFDRPGIIDLPAGVHDPAGRARIEDGHEGEVGLMILDRPPHRFDLRRLVVGVRQGEGSREPLPRFRLNEELATQCQ
jgi:hypothetical protein